MRGSDVIQQVVVMGSVSSMVPAESVLPDTECVGTEDGSPRSRPARFSTKKPTPGSRPLRSQRPTSSRSDPARKPSRSPVGSWSAGSRTSHPRQHPIRASCSTRWIQATRAQKASINALMETVNDLHKAEYIRTKFSANPSPMSISRPPAGSTVQQPQAPFRPRLRPTSRFEQPTARLSTANPHRNDREAGTIHFWGASFMALRTPQMTTGR